MAITASSWSQQATFEAAPISASQARRFVAGQLAEHRLCHLIETARLVTSELATNAVVHASTGFVVTLEVAGETLMLTVRDGGAPLPAQGPPPPMHTSGRGLDIVDSLSRDWGINEETAGSKTVWASFATAEQSV